MEIKDFCAVAELVATCDYLIANQALLAANDEERAMLHHAVESVRQYICRYDAQGGLIANYREKLEVALGVSNDLIPTNTQGEH